MEQYGAGPASDACQADQVAHVVCRAALVQPGRAAGHDDCAAQTASHTALGVDCREQLVELADLWSRYMPDLAQV